MRLPRNKAASHQNSNFLLNLATNVKRDRCFGGLSEANPPKTVNSISHRAKMAESILL